MTQIKYTVSSPKVEQYDGREPFCPAPHCQFTMPPPTKGIPIVLGCSGSSAHDSSACAKMPTTPGTGSYFSPIASLPLCPCVHGFVRPSRLPTTLFAKILPGLADVNDIVHSFIHPSHKFVSNNNYYQVLIWLLRKPHQTSITSSIFPSLNLTFFLSIDSVVVPLPLRAVVQG